MKYTGMPWDIWTLITPLFRERCREEGTVRSFRCRHSGYRFDTSFLSPHYGGDSGIRTHGPLRIKRFRVFYSQHTLADFEKKYPILMVNALVRKKMVFSPLRLFPTVRNARELSERTNRTAIKHNNRKSPLNQWFSELRQLKRSFDFECVMRYGKC